MVDDEGLFGKRDELCRFFCCDGHALCKWDIWLEMEEAVALIHWYSVRCRKSDPGTGITGLIYLKRVDVYENETMFCFFSGLSGMRWTGFFWGRSKKKKKKLFLGFLLFRPNWSGWGKRRTGGLDDESSCIMTLMPNLGFSSQLSSK